MTVINFTGKERNYLKKKKAWHREVPKIKNISKINANPMDQFSIPDTSGNFLDAFYNNKVKYYLNKINQSL